MLSAQINEIKGRIEKTDIGLKNALSIIDMVFDDSKPHSPHEAFRDLTRLIDRTVHGARIERFKPRGMMSSRPLSPALASANICCRRR